ncbi:MAG: ankyrin repeat domain-containing protein [Spirochaetaceae bacterium]
MVRNSAAVLLFLLLTVGAAAQKAPFDLFASGNLGDARRGLRDLDGIDSRDLSGMTPLMWAAKENEAVDVINFLISSGASVDARDNRGETAVMKAAGYNANPEVLIALVEAGADPDQSYGYLGRTPLMMAAGLNGNPEVADALIDFGASLTEDDSTVQHWTPLYYASSWNDNPEVTQLLIERGAQADQTTLRFNRTPLMEAVVNNAPPAVVEVLLQAGADPEASGPMGVTLLMEAAAFSKNPEILRLLVDYGAEVNRTDDRDGMTALMIACLRRGEEPVIRTFLELGADPRIRDRSGYTAADYAEGNSRLRNSEVLELLR